MVNKKRSNFKFSTLGISIGHTIVFTEYFNSDGTPITAVVVDDKNVLFRSTIQRLTPATLILLPHKKTTRPGRYWEYKGDKLIDLYEKNYPKPKGRLVMPVLDWIGKQAVVNHHKEVPYKLLHCDSSLSVGDPDSGNLIVEGDNLEALKALLPYYKGLDRYESAEEKMFIGNYWAEISDGKCLFCMPTDRNFDLIKNTIEK